MNAKQQIEQHIARQAEIMESWTAAAPEIRRRILSQEQQIEALKKQNAALERRLRALETAPRGLSSLFK